MKARHVEAERANARAVLVALKIGVDQDFHSLNSDQVAGLVTEAKRTRYQRPANANGSTARYYCALMQRRAR